MSNRSVRLKKDFALFDGSELFFDNHWMKQHTLGSRLSKLREERGLSRPKVHDVGGPAPYNLYRWEKDIHLPSIEVLFQLAKIYGVDAADMIDGLELE